MLADPRLSNFLPDKENSLSNVRKAILFHIGKDIFGEGV